MRDVWGAILPRYRTPAIRPRQPDASDLRADLQDDVDAICPRCLRFIRPRDIVRRTAYGLLQHERCPAVAGEDRPAGWAD